MELREFIAQTAEIVASHAKAASKKCDRIAKDGTATLSFDLEVFIVNGEVAVGVLPSEPPQEDDVTKYRITLSLPILMSR